MADALIKDSTESSSYAKTDNIIRSAPSCPQEPITPSAEAISEKAKNLIDTILTTPCNTIVQLTDGNSVITLNHAWDLLTKKREVSIITLPQDGSHTSILSKSPEFSKDRIILVTTKKEFYDTNPYHAAILISTSGEVVQVSLPAKQAKQVSDSIRQDPNKSVRYFASSASTRAEPDLYGPFNYFCHRYVAKDELHASVVGQRDMLSPWSNTFECAAKLPSFYDDLFSGTVGHSLFASDFDASLWTLQAYRARLAMFPDQEHRHNQWTKEAIKNAELLAALIWDTALEQQEAKKNNHKVPFHYFYSLPNILTEAKKILFNKLKEHGASAKENPLERFYCCFFTTGTTNTLDIWEVCSSAIIHEGFGGTETIYGAFTKLSLSPKNVAEAYELSSIEDPSFKQAFTDFCSHFGYYTEEQRAQILRSEHWPEDSVDTGSEKDKLRCINATRQLALTVVPDERKDLQLVPSSLGEKCEKTVTYILKLPNGNEASFSSGDIFDWQFSDYGPAKFVGRTTTIRTLSGQIIPLEMFRRTTEKVLKVIDNKCEAIVVPCLRSTGIIIIIKTDGPHLNNMQLIKLQHEFGKLTYPSTTVKIMIATQPLNHLGAETYTGKHRDLTLQLTSELNSLKPEELEVGLAELGLVHLGTPLEPKNWVEKEIVSLIQKIKPGVRIEDRSITGYGFCSPDIVIFMNDIASIIAEKLCKPASRPQEKKRHADQIIQLLKNENLASLPVSTIANKLFEYCNSTMNEVNKNVVKKCIQGTMRAEGINVTPALEVGSRGGVSIIDIKHKEAYSGHESKMMAAMINNLYQKHHALATLITYDQKLQHLQKFKPLNPMDHLIGKVIVECQPFQEGPLTLTLESWSIDMPLAAFGIEATGLVNCLAKHLIERLKINLDGGVTELTSKLTSSFEVAEKFWLHQWTPRILSDMVIVALAQQRVAVTITGDDPDYAEYQGDLSPNVKFHSECEIKDTSMQLLLALPDIINTDYATTDDLISSEVSVNNRLATLELPPILPCSPQSMKAMLLLGYQQALSEAQLGNEVESVTLIGFSSGGILSTLMLEELNRLALLPGANGSSIPVKSLVLDTAAPRLQFPFNDKAMDFFNTVWPKMLAPLKANCSENERKSIEANHTRVQVIVREDFEGKFTEPFCDYHQLWVDFFAKIRPLIPIKIRDSVMTKWLLTLNLAALEWPSLCNQNSERSRADSTLIYCLETQKILSKINPELAASLGWNEQVFLTQTGFNHGMTHMDLPLSPITKEYIGKLLAPPAKASPKSIRHDQLPSLTANGHGTTFHNPRSKEPKDTGQSANMKAKKAFSCPLPH